MELENNFDIEQFLDLSNYATDERVSRRKVGLRELAPIARTTPEEKISQF